ncbi:MAG: GNAT family N-acetyltransferase [Smithella sp.]|nr:GNAT family N-acetyltransferase [Smithella sp.]
MVKELRIEKYEVTHQKIWDEFITHSKNGTFLFYRNYMEYHSGKFIDHSLLFFTPANKLLAVLPANIEKNTLYSHSGLTYGGMVTGKDMRVNFMLDAFGALKKYLQSSSIDCLIYKVVPHIYHDIPAEEDLYALFINKAKLIRRDVATTIDFKNHSGYSERRKRGIKKAISAGLLVKESKDYKQYMNLVATNLEIKYGVRPVHSAEEIKILSESFTDHIKLFISENKQGEILAGVIIYETKTVAHAQYIATNEEGRENGALDILFDDLINHYAHSKKYFDFGISTENNGEFLNTGLIEQKEGFGGRATTYDHYKWIIK